MPTHSGSCSPQSPTASTWGSPAAHAHRAAQASHLGCLSHNLRQAPSARPPGAWGWQSTMCPASWVTLPTAAANLGQRHIGVRSASEGILQACRAMQQSSLGLDPSCRTQPRALCPRPPVPTLPRRPLGPDGTHSAPQMATAYWNIPCMQSWYMGSLCLLSWWVH